MGDGMGALAAAIFGAMAFMLIAGFAILFFITRAVAKARGADRVRARNIGLIGGVVGLGLGMIAVTATFMESTFSPPPRLELSTPPGYAHEWTFVLEDPSAPTTLIWRGSGLPFTQRVAKLTVPPNGVVRVRSVGEAAGRGDLDVRWSDGANYTGSGSGPAPKGLGATLYIALSRNDDPMRASAMLPYDDALGDLIRQREGRAAPAR